MNNKLSFVELNRLIVDGPLKDFGDAKEYILKYCFPLTNGMIMVLENNVKKMVPIETFRTVYASRFGKILMNWFLHSTLNVYDIIVDTSKPFISNENELNMFAGFKHNNESKYISCTDESKAGVNRMLDFIKTVWANDNETSYECVKLDVKYV